MKMKVEEIITEIIKRKSENHSYHILLVDFGQIGLKVQEGDRTCGHILHIVNDAISHWWLILATSSGGDDWQQQVTKRDTRLVEYINKYRRCLTNLKTTCFEECEALKFMRLNSIADTYVYKPT